MDGQRDARGKQYVSQAFQVGEIINLWRYIEKPLILIYQSMFLRTVRFIIYSNINNKPDSFDKKNSAQQKFMHFIDANIL